MSEYESSSSPGTFYYRSSTRADGSIRRPEGPVRRGYASTLNGAANVYLPPAKREINSWAEESNEELNGTGSATTAGISVPFTTTTASFTTPNTSPSTAPFTTTSSTAPTAPVITAAPVTKKSPERLEEPSWAEEESPVVKKFSESEGEGESDQANENGNSYSTSIPQTKREPSKLATAIDDALDNLSLDSSNGSNGSGERQIGRFATQIKNEQRCDYSQRYYQPRYNERRRPYEPQQQQQRPYEQRGYYNRGYYGNDYNNTSSQSSATASTTVATAPSAVEKQSTSSSLSPSQSYGECPRLRSCLETLSKCRREMAIINAKLEYIRYMRAAKDEDDFSPVEKERVGQEATLLTKINSIYEQIEALEI